MGSAEEVSSKLTKRQFEKDMEIFHNTFHLVGVIGMTLRNFFQKNLTTQTQAWY